MRRTRLKWQPCILIIIQTKLNTGKFPPFLARVHFSATPSRIQFDSEQFSFITIQSVFSALTAYCGHFQHNAALPPPSCCPSKLEPIPRWESLSQREALKNQNCFKASRRTFLQRLEPKYGITPTKYSFAQITRKQWYRIDCNLQWLKG